MTNAPETKTETKTETINVNLPLLAMSWLWAGVPLIWGVSQTLMKAMVLFK